MKSSSLLFPLNMPRERCLQLVKNALKELPPSFLFGAYPCFVTDEWGRISDFIIYFSSTSYMNGVFILFLQIKTQTPLNLQKD